MKKLLTLAIALSAMAVSAMAGSHFFYVGDSNSYTFDGNYFIENDSVVGGHAHYVNHTLYLENTEIHSTSIRGAIQANGGTPDSNPAGRDTLNIVISGKVRIYNYGNGDCLSFANMVVNITGDSLYIHNMAPNNTSSYGISLTSSSVLNIDHLKYARFYCPSMGRAINLNSEQDTLNVISSPIFRIPEYSGAEYNLCRIAGKINLSDDLVMISGFTPAFVEDSVVKYEVPGGEHRLADGGFNIAPKFQVGNAMIHQDQPDYFGDGTLVADFSENKLTLNNAHLLRKAVTVHASNATVEVHDSCSIDTEYEPLSFYNSTPASITGRYGSVLALVSESQQYANSILCTESSKLTIEGGVKLDIFGTNNLQPGIGGAPTSLHTCDELVVDNSSVLFMNTSTCIQDIKQLTLVDVEWFWGSDKEHNGLITNNHLLPVENVETPATQGPGKIFRNGSIYIRTADGVFTTTGQKVE